MNQKTMIIVVVVILILAIGGAFYISSQKNTEVLIVEVTLARPPDDDSEKIISQVNASISYVKRMDMPEDTFLSVPGITVLVIQNMKEMSGWYSVSIPSESSIYRSYSITVKPYDTFERTKPFRILARVVDPNGKDVSVKVVDIAPANLIQAPSGIGGRNVRNE